MPFRHYEFHYRYRTVDGTARSSGGCPDFKRKSGWIKVDSTQIRAKIRVHDDCVHQEPDEQFKVKFEKVHNSIVQHVSPNSIHRPAWYNAWPDRFEVTVTVRVHATTTFGE